MVTTSRLSSFVQVMACTLFLAVGASPVTAQSLSGRIVGHVVPENVKVFEVGDIPGHTITVVQARGLAFLENGEVAELTATETLDHINGRGTYRGYEVLTFEDGSTIVSQFEGNDRPSDDGKYSLFEGTYEYVGGSGRFAGIEGGGKHRGRNHVASGAGFFVEFDGTYSL